MFPTVYLTPVVSLIAGILILLIPRLLNYIVAIYLIVIGIIGLMHHKPQTKRDAFSEGLQIPDPIIFQAGS